MHERKAGGQKIALHQNVQHRLFHMFRKVEAARALVRRVATESLPGGKESPAFGRVYGFVYSGLDAFRQGFTQSAGRLQLFGGNGLTLEYLLEKLQRDARAGMIADGCNEVLALKGGSLLINPELL